MANLLRAQGATEYLVLLAVVLIVALVSVALLGFFPGMAGDTQREQSRAYWLSQTPIAVVDGSASSYDPTSDADEIVITLKNNAGYPVKLLAVSGTSGFYSSIPVPNDYGAPASAGEYYEFLAPGFTGSYGLYIAPPRGTGVYSSSYTSDIVLQPGEMITFGYTVGEDGSKYGIGSYCGADGDSLTGKFLTIKQFNIYYQSIMDGKPVLKKTTGAKPLILPCTDARLFS